MLVTGAVVFALWQIFLSRVESRPKGALFWAQEASFADQEEDLLAIELGARIFNPADSLLIRTETPPGFAHWFDAERKALALAWVRHVRIQVRGITRGHRQSARRNPGVKTGAEMNLAFQFILFELTSEILCWLIRVRGPSHLSGLIDSLLDGAGKLRVLVKGTVSTDAVIEIVKN
jgi:hypothetical protein